MPRPLERIEGAEISCNTPRYVELTARNCDKGSGLKLLMEHLGLDDRQVMVIGDSDNDRSMFTPGRTRVAVRNAEPEIRALADYITLDHDEDGVAYALETLLLGEKREKICTIQEVDMNALTIGMIGFGSIARTHCMAVAAIAADTGLPVRIGKIYRRNRSLAAPFFSLGYAQTLEELISESDVVDICSTNDVHFEQAAQVIRAGKNCTWKTGGR